MDKVILDHHHQDITIIVIIITFENYRHLIPCHIVRTNTYTLPNADRPGTGLPYLYQRYPFSYLH